MICLRKSVIAAFFVFLLAACQSAERQDDSVTVSIGKKYTLFSESLDQKREYFVHLPDSYHDKSYSNPHYPVLYVLDGGPEYLLTTIEVIGYGSNFYGGYRVPEPIIVAIPTGDPHRTRDLTPTHSTTDPEAHDWTDLDTSGGGERFLHFLKDELVPEIDSKYRTLPHRTLVGHSLGGLFALYTLLEAPEIFDAYVAIDPSVWWDDALLVRQAEQVLHNDQSRHASLYISLANRDPFNPLPGMSPAIRAFAAVLSDNTNSNIRSELQHFPSEDHTSVFLVSLYYGLLSVYEVYWGLKIDDVIEQPTLVAEHFEQLSSQIDISRLPPELYVDGLASRLLWLDKQAQAIELFKMNVANYPESANVYMSLGDAFEKFGNARLAIENYEKGLLIYPDHAWAKWIRENSERLRAQETASE